MDSTKRNVRLAVGWFLVIAGIFALSFDDSSKRKAGDWLAPWHLAVPGYALLILGSIYLIFVVYMPRATARRLWTALSGKKSSDDDE